MATEDPHLFEPMSTVESDGSLVCRQHLQHYFAQAKYISGVLRQQRERICGDPMTLPLGKNTDA